MKYFYGVVSGVALIAGTVIPFSRNDMALRCLLIAAVFALWEIGEELRKS